MQSPETPAMNGVPGNLHTWPVLQPLRDLNVPAIGLRAQQEYNRVSKPLVEGAKLLTSVRPVGTFGCLNTITTRVVIWSEQEDKMGGSKQTWVETVLGCG